MKSSRESLPAGSASRKIKVDFAGIGPNWLTLLNMRNYTAPELRFHMDTPHDGVIDGADWGGYLVRVLPGGIALPKSISPNPQTAVHAVLAAGSIPLTSLSAIFSRAKADSPNALRILLGEVPDQTAWELGPDGDSYGLIDGWLAWPTDKCRFLLGLSLVRPFQETPDPAQKKRFKSATELDLTKLLDEVESMRQSMKVCSLTGLLNRQGIEDRLGSEWEQSKRNGTDLALIMIDVDHFKSVNDKYLHPGGDAVLFELGRHLSSQLRIGDSVGRLGGDEFWIVAPETDGKGAMVLAQRLCESVCKHKFSVREQLLGMTVSVGVAVIQPEPLASKCHLYQQASSALREAKNQGRNRAVIHESDNTSSA